MSILYKAINKSSMDDNNTEQGSNNDLESRAVEQVFVTEPAIVTEQSADTRAIKFLLVAILLTLVVLLIVLIDMRFFSPQNINDELSRTQAASSMMLQRETGNQKTINRKPANQKTINRVSTGQTQASEADNSEPTNGVIANNDSNDNSYFETYQPNKAREQSLPSLSSEPNIDNSLSDTPLADPAVKRPASTQNNQFINDQLPITNVEDLTEVQKMMVDEVVIEAHVYSEDQDSRFVFVSGTIKQEGEQIINSWYLESVEQDAVIINNRILRVRLPLQ